MKLISTVTVGAGGTTSIDFTSIPQTFTDLILVMSARTTASSITDGNAGLTFNGSSVGFSGKRMYAYYNGGSAQASDNGNGFFINGASATANTFGSLQITIPNYTSANSKAYSIESVAESNDANLVFSGITSGLWSNSAAITRVTFAANFVQNCTATLYGITKGSGGATVA
jgi:hypothetical protein